MKQLDILVDMDDTLENLTEAWVSWANRRYGTAVKVDDIRSWDPSEAFPGVSHDQIYAILQEEALYRTLKPLPGAVEALKSLVDAGHRVYILSNTDYRVIRAKTEAVLLRYFPFIPMERVIFAARKPMIRADVLVDDGPHNLLSGEYAKLLFTAYHNRDFDAAAHGMTRVNTWPEALAEIERLAEGDTPGELF